MVQAQQNQDDDDSYDAEPWSGGDSGGREQQQPAQPFGQPGAAMAKAETAVSAIATQARARVEARYLMAVHRPRDIEAVRVKLLKECQRPGFAEAARYKRPVGRKKNERTNQWEEAFIEGPSIRFAEAAARLMGNLDVDSPTIYEDERSRIVRAMVTDLEANTTYSKDLTIEKTVERRQLKKGQKPLGTRQNSYGDTVYIVFATPSEVDVKAGAETSKAIRTLVLRLLPGDIQEECMAKCVETRDAKIKQDPDGERRKMIDAFAAIGVSPDELKLYVGQELASLSPAQTGELRDLYLAIKDGVTTWGDIKRARNESDDGDDDEGGNGGASRMEQLKNAVKGHADDVKKKKAADQAAAAPPATTAAKAEQPAASKPAGESKGAEQQKLGGT